MAEFTNMAGVAECAVMPEVPCVPEHQFVPGMDYIPQIPSYQDAVIHVPGVELESNQALYNVEVNF